jgi:anti-sigma factor RsiW
MNNDSQQLIHGYLDDTLSAEEHTAFEHWLQESPSHAQQFAAVAMLHDRLRSELALSELGAATAPPVEHTRRSSPIRSIFALTTTACLLLLLVAFVWQGFVANPVSAASAELERIISATAQSSDRTYEIAVEEVAINRRSRERDAKPDRGRPPKPSLDGARLHVRGANQFVLERTTADGLPFVTGSNGQTSWAVRPDGPVRVSDDLTRFNRDVPGHEHAMPLNNIYDGLEQLRTAYDVQLLPIENGSDDVKANDGASRLLVAVKRRGVRGPTRVEITYSLQSGQIRQLRFIEMPYGPERLTLRVTLVEERDLGPMFFDHTAHHAPDRAVEFEE